MGYQTVDFFKSTPYKTIKTDQLPIKITLLNIADLNEITNNHDNELTERKDPLWVPVLVGSIVAEQAITTYGRKVRLKSVRLKRIRFGKKDEKVKKFKN